MNWRYLPLNIAVGVAAFLLAEWLRGAL